MKNTLYFFCAFLMILGGCDSTSENTRNKQSAENNSLPLRDTAAFSAEKQASTISVDDTTEKQNMVNKKEKGVIEITDDKDYSKENPPKEKPDFINKVNVSNASTTLKSEAKKFCDFFKTFEEPSQFYTVPVHEMKEVKGKAGTIITINPDDLITLTNQPVYKNIQVELKELTNQQELLKTNAQTVCNGKQLISGGAYYINLKSEGEAVKLKPGRTLSVQFPKLTDAPMSLFSGYRDSLGQMQWQSRNRQFTTDKSITVWRDTRNMIIDYYDGDVLKTDTIARRKPRQQTEQEKQKAQAYDKLYAAMEIQNLGWINCDRFYMVQDKTDVSVKFTNDDPIAFASIYLVFDNMNSVIQTHYGATTNGVSNPGFPNIPIGSKVRVVAFSLKDNKMMAASFEHIIKRDETITISLKETSEEELKTMLAKK